MLIPTQRRIALRCPLCGRLEFNQVSLFDFSGRGPVRINCQCGFNKLIINTKSFKEFILQLPCLICEEVHIIKLKREDIWGEMTTILRCTVVGQELGFIGSEASLEKVIRQKQDDIESIINNLGFEDYFTNPQVMYEILTHLHQMTGQNKLFCSCGNNRIEIDVFPEKLELHCPYCQSIHIIYAETLEDLYMVKQANLIALTEKGFTSFDSSKIHPNLKS